MSFCHYNYFPAFIISGQPVGFNDYFAVLV